MREKEKEKRKVTCQDIEHLKGLQKWQASSEKHNTLLIKEDF